MTAIYADPHRFSGWPLCETLEPRTLYSAGQWDLSFGGNGKSQAVWSWITSLFVQHDGAIVVAGRSPASLARFTPDGRFDPTYGTGTVPNGSGDLQVFAFAMQGNDRVVELGVINSTGSLGVARIGTDGLLDATFGTNGETALLPGTSPTIEGFACAPDGKLIALITTKDGAELVRLNADGSVDTTFGNQGVVGGVVAPFQSDFEQLEAMRVDPFGRIVVGGLDTLGTSIARFNPDGTPDATFGSNGIVDTGEPGLNDVAVQSDGKVLFSGYQYATNGAPQYYLSRLQADGQRDATFAGVVANEVGPFSEAERLLVESDGKILLAGAGQNDYVVQRFNSDGTLDPSFSPGTAPVANQNYGGPAGIAPDGAILLGGNNGVVRFAGDVPVPQVTVTSDPPASGAGFTITRTGPTSYALWVNLEAGGTAVPGADYEPIPQGILIPAGQQSIILPVQRLASANSAVRTVTLQVLNNGDMPRYLAMSQGATITIGNPDESSISGIVFIDANLNGTLDDGELGLSGATIYVDSNGNGKLDAGEIQTTSTADGTYYLTGLAPGTYLIREQPPAGYAITSPLGYSGEVTVPASGSATGPTFGNVQLATVPMDFNYLIRLARNYGQPGTFATGDLNGDGEVSFDDLVIVARNYGRPLSSVSTAAAVNAAAALRSVVDADALTGAILYRHLRTRIRPQAG